MRYLTLLAVIGALVVSAASATIVWGDAAVVADQIVWGD